MCLAAEVFIEDLGLKGCGCVCTQVFGGNGVYQRICASRDAGANGHAGPFAPGCLAGKVFIQDFCLKGGGCKRSCMTVCTQVSGGKNFYQGFGPQGVRVQTVMHDWREGFLSRIWASRGAGAIAPGCLVGRFLIKGFGPQGMRVQTVMHDRWHPVVWRERFLSGIWASRGGRVQTVMHDRLHPGVWRERLLSRIWASRGAGANGHA